MNANTLRPARRSTASRKTAAIVSWNSSAMRFTSRSPLATIRASVMPASSSSTRVLRERSSGSPESSRTPASATPVEREAAIARRTPSTVSYVSTSITALPGKSSMNARNASSSRSNDITYECAIVTPAPARSASPRPGSRCRSSPRSPPPAPPSWPHRCRGPAAVRSRPVAPPRRSSPGGERDPRRLVATIVWKLIWLSSKGTRPRDLRSSYVTLRVYEGIPLTEIARGRHERPDDRAALRRRDRQLGRKTGPGRAVHRGGSQE